MMCTLPLTLNSARRPSGEKKHVNGSNTAPHRGNQSFPSQQSVDASNRLSPLEHKFIAPQTSAASLQSREVKTAAEEEVEYLFGLRLLKWVPTYPIDQFIPHRHAALSFV